MIILYGIYIIDAKRSIHKVAPSVLSATNYLAHYLQDEVNRAGCSESAP